MNHSIPQSRFPLHIPRRRGFSFVEVLFAVMLLGIGFIMIAGVFPVAIEQTQITSNETSGALVARDAIRQIQAIANEPGAYALFPAPTGDPIVPIGISGNTALATAIGTNGFFSADRRFCWAAFYSRNNADPFAQVFITVLQNPNFQQSNYFYYNCPPPIPNTNTISPIVTTPTVPAYPSTVVATLAYSPSTGNSYVYLYNTNYTTPQTPTDPVANAAPGAYVLVSQLDPGFNQSNYTGTPPPAEPLTRPPGALTGRFFKLAQPIAIATAGNGTPPAALPADVSPAFPTLAPSTTPVDVYQLEPGSDLKDLSEVTTKNDGTASTLNVYIVGRAPEITGTAGVANFTGPVQDITTASSVIRINTAN